MEKQLSKIIKKSLDKEYPFFEDVEVTKERNERSYYIDKEKNYTYNIFLIIYEENSKIISNYGNWPKVREFVRDIVEMCGVNSQVDIYVEYPE